VAGPSSTDPVAVVAALHRAMNAHDLEAFLALFDPGYGSQQPAHPDRAFRGTEQVRSNWSGIFDGVPDLDVDVVHSAVAGDSVWSETRWHGNRRDGTVLDMAGVTIFGVRDGRIAWARLYMEPVEQGGAGVGVAAARMVRR
jgi:limonene-1,2-epoxide hydrolase